jgi:hypothetical protein
MRFHRKDLPGLLIAVGGPVGLMLVFLAAFDVWDHHGTPLLGAMAGNLAVGGGLLAAFTRFIRSWDVILGLLLILALAVAAVIGLQQTGEGGTAIEMTGRWIAVIAFLLLNIVIPLQIINNGLIPMLNRREERLTAEPES